MASREGGRRFDSTIGCIVRGSGLAGERDRKEIWGKYENMGWWERDAGETSLRKYEPMKTFSMVGQDVLWNVEVFDTVTFTRECTTKNYDPEGNR